jgi:hypothetical protein
MEWISCHGFDPLAGHHAGIENRELRPVVLEALPFLVASDGDHVVSRIGLHAGHRQAPKDSIPPLAPLRKHQEGWNLHFLVGGVVQDDLPGTQASGPVELMSARAPVQVSTATEYEAGVPGGAGDTAQYLAVLTRRVRELQRERDSV